jgi:iron complex transport system substrate-binding protein
MRFSVLNFWVLIWGVAMINACQAPVRDTVQRTDTTVLKYASGFSIQQAGAVRYVTVHQPYPGAARGFRYLLVPKGEPVPAHEDDITVIHTPVERIVCTSTTHIPLLDYLDASDALIGFPTTDYISSEKMRQRIEAGHVVELGIDKGMNIELLFNLKPDLVMSYAMNSDPGQLKKVRELGIPVIVNSEYLEKHPLGRAEWIKFMALFFNKEKQADSVFNRIEKEYLQTLEWVKNTSVRPTVLSGILYGSAWFMPGGDNYAARLLRDAGMDYLWSKTESSGFLELSFESVFMKAKETDYWIGVGTYQSLAEMKAAEPRYALFKPFQQKNVFTYNARLGRKGGSEFLELGYLRPDLILKDLVKIAHPDLLPAHDLYFHRRLE